MNRGVVQVLAALLVAVAISLTITATAEACEGDRIAKFVSIAVDRCVRQDVTLTFDGATVKAGDRTFITIDREDGRKLYEQLRTRYEGGTK